MKFRYLIAMTAALSISAHTFAADNAETLFTENNCNNCHNRVKDVIGPSVKAVAIKYKGNDNAQAMLEKKVRDGGKGTWGNMSMPATPPSVSDEDIKAMVAWMLAQEGELLFKQANCSTCHALDKKTMGPSLKVISTKYASDKDALPKLLAKVRAGGSGTFGSMSMPATNESISDINIYTMLSWILTQPTLSSDEFKAETREDKKEAVQAVKEKRSGKKAK